MSKLLIVDDEQSMREFLALLLKKEGYEVVSAKCVADALSLLPGGGFDLVVTDLKLPDGTGLQILKETKAADPDAQVLMITAFSSAETAVEAMKQGAYDYIGKPFKVDHMLVTIRKALERCALSRENRELRRKIEEAAPTYGIERFGNSAKIREMLALVDRVAPTGAMVLVCGESGTGKELVAKRIHEMSGRKGRFVPVNCSAIPEGLIESELFGHVKGSFTGAVSDKTGLFEEAHQGTLFLDEVSELPLSLQPKLLRALQEGRIKRVGGNREIEIDARIISATNRDLKEAAREGRFREDLYYRLNVLAVELPPLRARKADIPLLANQFLSKYRAQFGRMIKTISPEFLECLESYDFPGNVRELENIVERAVALETGESLGVSSLPPHLGKESVSEAPYLGRLPEGGMDLDDFMQRTELFYINKAIDAAGGNKTRAAALLGMSFRSLRYRLEKLGLETQ